MDDLVRTMVSRSAAGSPVDEAVWVGLVRSELVKRAQPCTRP